MTDQADQRPMAANLNPGQRIVSPTDGQIKTIRKNDGYAPYVRIEFTDGDWFAPIMTTRFEVHVS